jgi:hypothetical protein
MRSDENRTDRTHITKMRRFTKNARTRTMEKTPAAEKPPAKTEAELIATVANIQDAEASLLFARRAIKAGMPKLAAACEERAKTLKPIKPTRAKKPPSTAREPTAEVREFPGRSQAPSSEEPA